MFLKVFNDYANMQHIDEMRFQSYLIKNPLGIRRLMVAESFINFMSLMNVTTRNVVQESEINCIFQIIFVWLLEKRHHSIYSAKLLGFLNCCVKNKMENTLVVTLIKLNTIGIIYDAYLSICVNSILQVHLHIDQLNCFIMEFVRLVKKYIKNADHKSDKLVLNLNRLITWAKLLEILE
jgi:hypothetical protein